MRQKMEDDIMLIALYSKINLKQQLCVWMGHMLIPCRRFKAFLSFLDLTAAAAYGLIIILSGS